MRMAKTAFPGLGSPITHVDVTYDGKWILGTTDTYLILIRTIFIDKDGKENNGFSGRMGNRFAAPRLLKLNPLDSHLVGADNRFMEGRFSWRLTMAESSRRAARVFFYQFTYLILICTIFIDKDGKENNGFSGRMGNRIAAPRLLKLNPLDYHLAGADNRFREGRFSWVCRQAVILRTSKFLSDLGNSYL